MGAYRLCLAFLLCTCAVTVIGHINNTMKTAMIALRAELLTNLGPNVPPITFEGSAIKLNFSVASLHINDLNSATETLHSTAHVLMAWYDKTVSWSPGNHSGIQQLQFDISEVWTPVLLLSNSVGNSATFSTTVPILLTADGKFLWQIPATWATTCTIYIERYPFDEQFCDLMFTRVEGFLLDITANTSIGPNTDIGVQPDTTGEWEFLSVSLVTFGKERQLPGVHYRIHMKRRYLFHMLNVVFPMSILSFTSSMVFLLPTRSGEKIGFVMAVFVSNALFLTYNQESMPHTSTSVSSLSVYLTLIQIQEFLTMLGTIVVHIVYDQRIVNQELKVKVNKVKVTPVDSDGSDPKRRSLRDRFREAPADRKLDCIFFCISFFLALLAYMTIIL
ncbi:acetylcholine receptor subunit beta-like [Haliotis rufescens]|uniref:acetylcholine receptor subunit beta-like n=1 Tax=Haliotis rufescens TaxID=6454 RepID=UPI00201EE53B|nr:acetylcholine receptor subunit beta-like [Haliotis rufescens]